MQTQKLHPNFCINGKNLDYHNLLETAYSYLKEGEAFEKEVGKFLLAWLDKSETLTVYSSGSTGTPKAIALKKEHMVNSANATGAYFQLQPKNSALLCLPANYIAGKMMLVRAMVLGLDIYPVEPSAEPLTNLNKNFDFAAMVPMQVMNSISKLDQIHTLLIGGAPMTTNLKNKLEGCSTAVYETYGMTETITHIAVKSINEPYFTALPNVRFSQNERGCLVIDAPGVSTAPIHTNDMVKLISKIQFKWLGRLDNVVNSGGIKLHPELIEEKIGSYLQVPFFVFGSEDEKLGEKLILVAETKSSVMEIKNALQSIEELGPYEMPRKILTIPKFVRTKNGKIKRNKTFEKALEKA